MVWLGIFTLLSISQPADSFCSSVTARLQDQDRSSNDSVDLEVPSERDRAKAHQRRVRFLYWLLGGGGTLISIAAANSHWLVAPYTNGAQNGIQYRQAAREELRREGFNARSDSMKSFIQSISNSGQLPQTLEIGGSKKAIFSNSMPYYGQWQHFYNVNDAEIERMQVTVRFDGQQKVKEVLVTFYVQTGYPSSDGIRWPTMVSYTYDRDGNLKAFD